MTVDLESIYQDSLTSTAALMRLTLERKTKPHGDQIRLVQDDHESPLCLVVRSEQMNINCPCAVSVVVPRVSVQIYCVRKGVSICQN